MKFLRSSHVLVLLLAILSIEVVVRLGAYEPFAEPDSHSGITIKLKTAVQAFGKEKVNVVTLGDSRAAQGLDNQLIFDAARPYGLNHVRLSMPGSHFLTFKTLAAWTTEKLPGLRGIVLAVSPDILGRVGSGPYELAEVLPLRNETSISEMLHHVPFNRSDLRTYTPFYSLAGYRDDIKELLADPGRRWREISKYNTLSPISFLAYNAQEPSDLCAIASADPQQCLDELQQVRSDVPEKARRGLKILCEAAIQKRPRIHPGQAEEDLIKEWKVFLEDLSRKVRVMVVLLPDHSLFVEHLYAPNATYVTNAVMGELKGEGVIDLVDLRDLVVDQEERECSFYSDARHLNSRGKQLLTSALLPELEKFWRQLEGPETEDGMQTN